MIHHGDCLEVIPGVTYGSKNGMGRQFDALTFEDAIR